MTKDDLEKLIADQPQDVKITTMLLFNNYQKAKKKLSEESSSANLRNYQAAQEAWNEHAARLGWSETEGNFDNIAAVLQHLEGAGWKVTKTSLYRHQKEGKILPDAAGRYPKKAVEKYAKTFLKQLATGKRVTEAQDELQRRKLEKEIARLELGIERDQFALDKDRGLFIPRDQMEIELATRAGVLVAGLKHWVQSKAADWITSVGGDTKRTGELINTMTRDVDEHINLYASSKEYEVMIEEETDINLLTTSHEL
jgi:hypothetical protein